MAQVLDSVLSGHILMNDIKQWLKSDKLDNSKAIGTEKCEFIPYFLNYVRENCTWLLCKNTKNLDASPAKRVQISQVNNRCDLSAGRLNYLNFQNSPKDIERPTQVTKSEEIYGDENKYRKDYNFVHPKSSEKVYGNERILSSKNFQGMRTVEQHIPHSKEKYSSVHAYSPKIGNDGKSIGQYQKCFTDNVIKTSPKNSLDELQFSSLQNASKKGFKMGCTPYSQRYQDFKNAPQIKTIPNEAPDINNLDAFPPVGAKVDDNRVKRRITPTPVQSVNSGSTKFGHSRFCTPTSKVPNEAFKSTSFQEVASSDLQHEREMLKMAKNQLSQSNSNCNMVSEPKNMDISISQPKNLSVEYVVPDPKGICHMKEILVITEIYDILLTNALVPNVTSELYFMFELMTAKITSEDIPVDENNIFCNVHNCVYFAVSVLAKQYDLLILLDNATLASMSEIPYLVKFSPQLINFLQICCRVEQDVSTKLHSLKGVPFLLEEDSKVNFPDDYSFINFKKQRDLFYELLREWQLQSLDYTDIKSREKFSRKAKLLVNLCPNTVNLFHLARLFQSQLIASCLCLEVNEVYDELLTDIQKNFPGKIEKLRERFLMPFSIGEPNPPPTFYGMQAFFCELIQNAASPTLNQHIVDLFVCKLMELDNTDIFSDDELSSLGTIKEKYIFLLHTLRLLGKFLGFLYFLPYRMSDSLPVNILNCQLLSRKCVNPPLDLPKILKQAIKNNKVLLTVPWIVEYLSMIDTVAQNLEDIQETLGILISIYRGKYFSRIETQSFWFLRLLIGWLFDVLHYPKTYSILIHPSSFHYSQNLDQKGIDFLAIIDKQLVHSCCPYLIGFKALIYNFLNGIKNKNREIRKITPLSTAKPFVSASVGKQQIEQQLEENFFFIHPPSLKKTVEFVSERIASKVISRIRLEVTNLKLKSVEFITQHEHYKEISGSKISSIQKQKQLDSFIDSCILKSYDEFQHTVNELIKNTCQTYIESVIPLLLSEDTKLSVVKMSCNISFRLAMDKIIEWCDTNLVLDLITCDVKNKIQHLIKGNTAISDYKISNASDWINFLRRSTVKVFNKSENFNRNSFINMCSEILPIVTNNHIVHSFRRMIVLLTIDLYIALLTNFPETCTGELNENFISLWVKCPENLIAESHFLCPQNIKFLQASKQFETSWYKYVNMIIDLLKRNVLQLKELERCMNSVCEIHWDDSVLEKLLLHWKTVICDFCCDNSNFKDLSNKLETFMDLSLSSLKL